MVLSGLSVYVVKEMPSNSIVLFCDNMGKAMLEVERLMEEQRKIQSVSPVSFPVGSPGYHAQAGSCIYIKQENVQYVVDCVSLLDVLNMLIGRR